MATRRLNSAALSTLRFFESTARLGSFTRAAEELCITQSAVSQHIKALENRLGCKLFFRMPGQIKLTDEGRKFAEVVTRVLRDLEQAAEFLASPRRSKIDVRLRAGPSFAHRWLIPRLGRLHARQPNLTLHVIGDHGYLDPAQRDFDLAVEMTVTPPQHLQVETLMEEYLTPICSREYLTQHPFLLRPADLAQCELLHDGQAWPSASEDAEWSHWLGAVGASEVDSGEGQFFSLADMAIEAALAHQGIAIGRLSLVQPLLADRKLVDPFSQRIKSPAIYRLVYPSELAGRPGVSEVAAWLREEARSASQAHAAATARSNGAANQQREAPPSAPTPTKVKKSASTRGDVRTRPNQCG